MSMGASTILFSSRCSTTTASVASDSRLPMPAGADPSHSCPRSAPSPPAWNRLLTGPIRIGHRVADPGRRWWSWWRDCWAVDDGPGPTWSAPALSCGEHGSLFLAPCSAPVPPSTRTIWRLCRLPLPVSSESEGAWLGPTGAPCHPDGRAECGPLVIGPMPIGSCPAQVPGCRAGSAPTVLGLGIAGGVLIVAALVLRPGAAGTCWA